MATYAEALFLERAYSRLEYANKIERDVLYVENTIPVYKKCDVLYNSWVNDSDKDIYHKGALMLHSLRMVVDNDSLFFKAIRTMSQEFSMQHVSTDQAVAAFNKHLGADYSVLFDWYLKRVKPPVLDVYLDGTTHELHYQLQDAVPFSPTGELLLFTSGEIGSIRPTTEYQTVKLKESNLPQFMVSPSIYYIPETKKKI